MDDRISIRIRPFISYLGGATGAIAAAPSVLGCFYFLFNPAEALADPWSVLFCFVLGSSISWLTFRWLTIRGEADSREIYLRGLWKTIALPTDRLMAIRRVLVRSYNLERGDNERWDYMLVGHGNKYLGSIPRSLGLCTDWERFLARLQQLAAESRSRNSGDRPRRLEDIPASEWTLEDVERYETQEDEKAL